MNLQDLWKQILTYQKKMYDKPKKVLMHPATLNELAYSALTSSQYGTFNYTSGANGAPTIFGIPVETSQNVPQGLAIILPPQIPSNGGYTLPPGGVNPFFIGDHANSKCEVKLESVITDDEEGAALAATLLGIEPADSDMRPADVYARIPFGKALTAAKAGEWVDAVIHDSAGPKSP